MTRLRSLGAGACAVVAISALLAQIGASAAVQSSTDPSDAPAGAQGTTDLRSVSWDVGASTTTHTVSVDESTYKPNAQRADLGLHVFVDTDANGLADAEISGTRNPDGTSMDVVVRTLNGTLSTADCQDLAGQATAAAGNVSGTVANGIETFSFTFASTALPLSQFAWGAVALSPPTQSTSSSWDYLPDAANPDPTATNPGDRRCAGSSGLRARVTTAFAADPGTTLQTTTDPSDAPTAANEPDLRSLVWDVGSTTTTLTVSLEESGLDRRAELGVHDLLDTDADGLADAEVTAVRNADGVQVDTSLRLLDRTLSTAGCQDLTGRVVDQTTVSSTVAGGQETFSYTFATNLVPGGLSSFRWAAFGQSPPDAAAAGPWDYAPDATNPDPTGPNPGDRRCNANNTGILVNVAAGGLVQQAGGTTSTPTQGTPPDPGSTSPSPSATSSSTSASPSSSAATATPSPSGTSCAGRISLAGPARVPLGARVSLTGHVSGGSAVTILFRRRGESTFVPRRSVVPAADGSFAASYLAADDYRLYASAGACDSSLLLVTAMPTISGPVTVARGASVTLTVRGFAGVPVKIYFHRAGTLGYRAGRFGTLDGAGRFVTTYRATADYRYYAVTGPDGRESTRGLTSTS